MILRRYLTTKQNQILAVIAAGNADGSFVDLDQLLERLPYETTKQSIHFSIRALVAREYLEKAGVEKRRGRSHMLLKLGAAGAGMYATTGAVASPSSFVTDEATDGAEQLLEELSS
jgi:hypothetical protein